MVQEAKQQYRCRLMVAVVTYSLFSLLTLQAARPASVAVKVTTFPLNRTAIDNTTVTAVFTIYAPPAATKHQEASRPAVFLMNGFNVESARYSDLVERLALAGLIVATAEETRAFAFPPGSGMPRPGCPSEYTYISGAHLNTLFDAKVAGAREFNQVARANGVMLLGHSNGEQRMHSGISPAILPLIGSHGCMAAWLAWLHGMMGYRTRGHETMHAWAAWQMMTAGSPVTVCLHLSRWGHCSVHPVRVLWPAAVCNLRHALRRLRAHAGRPRQQPHHGQLRLCRHAHFSHVFTHTFPSPLPPRRQPHEGCGVVRGLRCFCHHDTRGGDCGVYCR